MNRQRPGLALDSRSDAIHYGKSPQMQVEFSKPVCRSRAVLYSFLDLVDT
jgi:hypothetical protein